MLELPMNNTPPDLGGFALSLSSNLAMADSHRSAPCFFASAAPAPDKQASVAAKASGVIDFVKIPFNIILRMRIENLSRPASGCKGFHRQHPRECGLTCPHESATFAATMKINKIKFVFSLAAMVAFLAVGCQKEEDPQQNLSTEQKASLSEEEKESMQGMEEYDNTNNPDNRKE